jgi:hypothetical protein
VAASEFSWIETEHRERHQKHGNRDENSSREARRHVGGEFYSGPALLDTKPVMPFPGSGFGCRLVRNSIITAGAANRPSAVRQA